MKMNVWPSSQNFCRRHVSSTLYSDWYSSFPQDRHLVSSFSVQYADRYVPVFRRKTPLLCLLGVAHRIPALFRSSAEPVGCFYEVETKLRFSYCGYVGVPLSYSLPLQYSKRFQSFIQISISIVLYHIWLSRGNEKYWKVIYLVCTCYSISCLSRGTASGCMLVLHIFSATKKKN